MSTYTQIIYHIVFSTKDRKPCLKTEKRDELFKYIWGLIRNKKCHLYRINGTDDHIHILAELHPTVCLADLIKDIKLSASQWIKAENVFPGFMGWQTGYGAFTVSPKGKDALIEYIKNQENHHRRTTFTEELRILLDEAGIVYDPKYLA